MKQRSVIILLICCVCGLWGCQAAPKLTPEEKRIRALIAKLHSEKLKDQVDATFDLGDIGPHAYLAIPFLIGKLRAKDVDLKLTAMGALGKIGPASRMAIPVLMEYLYSDDRDLCLNAATTLGEFGPDAKIAVPRLSELLEKEHTDRHYWGIRLAKALGDIGPQAAPAVPAMIRVFKIKQDDITRELSIKHDKVSCQIALALGRIGPAAKAAVPVLVEGLQAVNPDMRKAAAVGLVGIGGPYEADAVAVLLKAIETPMAELGASDGKDPSSLHDAFCALDRQAMDRQNMIPFALSALAKDGNSRQAMSAITAVLKGHPYGGFRKIAAHSLGEITPRSALIVPALTDALKDKDSGVVAAARLALAKIEPNSMNITGIMTLLVESSSIFDRLDAMDILGKLGPAAQMAVPALKKVLKGDSPMLSQAAAKALESIQAPHKQEEPVPQRDQLSILGELLME